MMWGIKLVRNFCEKSKIIVYFCQNCQDFIGKTMRENFNEYIRNLRTSKDYTLTQLAAKLGIDSGALSKIETGKKVLNEKLLPKLVEIFDLNEKDVKDEYYSELIAKILFEKKCSDEVLSIAKDKLTYRRNKSVKQSNLNFK